MQQTPLKPLTSDLLTHPGVTHGFFTRHGGVSYGTGDLNCGPKSQDDAQHLAENRSRVARHLGGSLEGVSQYHSAKVISISTSQRGALPDADGLVTNVPGLAISVLSADCGPLLFLDPAARVIGAAHSGWKGTVGNIAMATVSAMEALGAHRDNIRAVLGPTIAQQSYEVAPNFADNLAGVTPDPTLFMVPSITQGHWMFDLPGLIGWQLGQLVGQHQIIDADTYSLEDQFFSYRRATHRGAGGYGRQISGICLGGGA